MPSECRSTQRQSLSCPDRCRSDNGKAPTISPPGLFADVQLKLPALLAVTGYAPDLERADFCNSRLEPDRDNRSMLPIQCKRDFQRPEFLEIVTPIFQQAANLVLLTNGGSQETKLGWFAYHQAKLSVGNRRLRAFLHPKRNDAERLERSFHAGNRRHGAFNSDVVRTRNAAANTHAAPESSFPIIGSTARNGMFQIRGFEDLLFAEQIQPLFSYPTVQHFNHTVTQHPGLHHSAVEQYVRRARQSAA